MKGFYSAIFLATVILILGVVSYWDEYQTERDEKREDQKAKIVQCLADDVVGFALKEIDLRKEDDTWFLFVPFKVRADQEAVKYLLSSVVNYKFEKEISDDKSSWQSYGLVDPVYKIDLKCKSEGENQTIYFGSDTPTGYSINVATSRDSKVYVASQQILNDLKKTVDDLRDKVVVNIAEDGSVVDVEFLKAGQKKPVLVADKDDHRYEGILSELNSMRAIGFIDNPKVKFKKDYEISWKVAEGEKSSLVFYSNKEDFYVTQNPSLMHKVPKSFRKSFDELFHKKKDEEKKDELVE
jgi:hypothetical protein